MTYVSSTTVAYEVYVKTAHRVYVVSCHAPVGEEASLSEPRDRFFRSLRIL